MRWGGEGGGSGEAPNVGGGGRTPFENVGEPLLQRDLFGNFTNEQGLLGRMGGGGVVYGGTLPAGPAGTGQQQFPQERYQGTPTEPGNSGGRPPQSSAGNPTPAATGPPVGNTGRTPTTARQGDKPGALKAVQAHLGKYDSEESKEDSSLQAEADKEVVRDNILQSNHPVFMMFVSGTGARVRLLHSFALCPQARVPSHVTAAGFVSASASDLLQSRPRQEKETQRFRRRSSSLPCCRRITNLFFAVMLLLLVILILLPQIDAQSGTACGCQFDHACFPSDGVLLKFAVDAYTGGNWNGMLFDVNYGLNISEWCTGLVTYMGELFFEKSNFDGDLSLWNTASVKDMDTMFYFASSFTGLGIAAWDVSAVTDMKMMFYRASSFIGEGIGNWEVSNVHNMVSMFEYATSFTGNISSWDVSAVTDMSSMFSSATHFTGEGIGNWEVSKVRRMVNMFSLASSFTGDISSWNVSTVTDMAGMFSLASSFTGDISSWDVSAVTDMTGMFFQATSFDRNLCAWRDRNFPYDKAQLIFHDSGCTYKESPNEANGGPFCAEYCCGCQFDHACFPSDGVLLKFAVDAYTGGNWNGMLFDVNYGLNISEWCTGLVTYMGELFFEKSNFDGDLSLWNTASVKDMDTMFYFASSFTGLGIAAWDVSAVTDMKMMFYRASSFIGEGIGNWEVSNVHNMVSMFEYATSFTGNISSWDVSAVTDMSSMFSSATHFTGEGIGNWEVSKVRRMVNMFSLASSFTGDISSWNVSTVTDMAGMFSLASSFTGDISSWDVSAVTDMTGMFFQATSFDRNLCAWRDRNFPYDKAQLIFHDSGCTYKESPNEANGGPFCADDCAPSNLPSATPTISLLPTTSQILVESLIQQMGLFGLEAILELVGTILFSRNTKQYIEWFYNDYEGNREEIRGQLSNVTAIVNFIGQVLGVEDESDENELYMNVGKLQESGELCFGQFTSVQYTIQMSYRTSNPDVTVDEIVLEPFSTSEYRETYLNDWLKANDSSEFDNVACSGEPTLVAVAPSDAPSSSSITATPSSSSIPTLKPSSNPSVSVKPSNNPTSMPSSSSSPTFEPSLKPSDSAKPSEKPSSQPSIRTSMKPSLKPSVSVKPTTKPTKAGKMPKPRASTSKTPKATSLQAQEMKSNGSSSASICLLVVSSIGGMMALILAYGEVF